MASADIFDVVVVGSGAGGGPLTWELAMAGARVLVLEKGPALKRSELIHDEMKFCRDNYLSPSRDDEPHMLVRSKGQVERSSEGWIASCVGGGTLHMSGFFLRLKPEDFQMRTLLGDLPGANLADWPVPYLEFAKYYDRVEEVIGVSGRAGVNPFEEPRNGPFAYPPLDEHPIAQVIDATCARLGYHAFPTPRGILSRPKGDRGSCSYCALCAQYGCETGAKASTAASVLPAAVATGRCEIRPNCMVHAVEVNERGLASGVLYFDETGAEQRARGRVIVVSATAIESARLLLNSKNSLFPNGVANHGGLVGQNLTFSNGSTGQSRFSIPANREAHPWVTSREPFVHRCIQDFYFNPTPDCPKGGTISFIATHPNPILSATRQSISNRDEVVFGKALKDRLRQNLRESFNLRFETFTDFIPNPNTHVTIDPEVVDKWDIPVARITVEHHPYDQLGLEAVHAKAVEITRALDPTEFEANAAGLNGELMLQHGTCRFGNDPRTSVLDRNCRSHEVRNLLVVDGSFMPSCGGVPPTWTIMANSFRAGEALAHAFRRREIPG